MSESEREQRASDIVDLIDGLALARTKEFILQREDMKLAAEECRKRLRKYFKELLTHG